MNKVNENDVIGSEAYEKSHDEAERMFNDPDRVEEFLKDLEKKLASVPKIGHWLAEIPVFVSMVRDYFRKEYTMPPVGTIVGALAALVYFVSPVDFIPDTIPGLGLVDDAMVVTVTARLIAADLDAYKKWRKENGKDEEKIIDADYKVSDAD